MAGIVPAAIAAAEDESGDYARDEGLALSKEDMLRDKMESQQVLIRHLKAEKEKLSLSLVGLPVMYKIMQDLQDENKLLKEECAKSRAALTTCIARLQSLGVDPTSCDPENAELLAAAPPGHLVDRLLQENAQLKNHLSQLISNPSGINSDTNNSALMLKQRADIERLSGQLRQLEAVLSGSADHRAAEVGRLSTEAARLHHQLQLVNNECSILRNASDRRLNFERLKDEQQETNTAVQQRLSLEQKVIELEKLLREQKASYEGVMMEKQRLASELDAARSELVARPYQCDFLQDSSEQPLRVPSYAQAAPDRLSTRGYAAVTTKLTDLQLAGRNASATHKGTTYDSELRQLPPPS